MKTMVILWLWLLTISTVGTATANHGATQQHIRTATRAVAARLQSLVDEYARNGLPTEDAEMSRAVQAILMQLTDGQMARVATLLEQTEPRPHTIAAAYAAQKTIIVQMQQLLLNCQRRVELVKLADRFRTLTDRQVANQRETSVLAAATRSRFADFFTENQMAALQAQRAEQSALRDELQMLLDKLERWGREGFSSEAKRCRTVAQQAAQNGLLTHVTAAVTALQRADLDEATTVQLTIVGQLRTLHRLLRPPHDWGEELRAAAEHLDALLERQQEIILEIQTQATQSPTDHVAPQPSWQPSPTIARQQAGLVPRAETIRQQVEQPALPAAIELQWAAQKMTHATDALDTGNLDQALMAAKDAWQNLRQAQQSIQSALARPFTLPAMSLEQQAELKAVQTGIRSLQTQQERLRLDTQQAQPPVPSVHVARQLALAESVRDLQRRAARFSPTAAHELAQAQTQMQQAYSDLAHASDPTTAQQAARDALGRADERLDEILQKSNQLQQQSTDIAVLCRQLAELIARQQRVQAESISLTGTTPSAPRFFEPLALAQDRLAADTRGLPDALPSAVAGIASSLRTAVEHMFEARDQLWQEDGRAAVTEQNRALEELYQALAVVETRAAAAQRPTTNDLSQTADLLQKAQRQVARAQEYLEQAAAQPEDASVLSQADHALQNAAHQIAPLTVGLPALPANARTAAQDAQQALAAARLSAVMSTAAQALAHATAAQIALTRAQTSLVPTLSETVLTPPTGGPSSDPTGVLRGVPQAADAGAWAGSPVPALPEMIASQLIALPERDRQAIQQSQSEPYPVEYRVWVEQYLRNLADVVGKSNLP